MTIYQESLWYAGTDDWEKAHDLIQDLPGEDAALLHAYLHRVEGDLWNAGYWYKRAGSQTPSYSVEEEWKILVQRFS